MTREPREDLVLELLKANWDATNTFGVTPKLTFGQFDDSQNTPQVTVDQPEESPVDGGQTGYSSMKADGSGPSKTMGGSLLIHAFATAAQLKAQNADTTNPRQYNERVLEEAERILDANAVNPTNPDTGAQPVNYLTFEGRGAPSVDDDRQPPVYHYPATAGYGYGPT